MSDVEKRVVIRLMAESQMEEVQKASKIVRNFLDISGKADKSMGQWWKTTTFTQG